MLNNTVVRVKGLHVNTKIKEIKSFFSPIRVENAKFFKNGVCLVTFRNDVDFKNALTKKGEIHGRTVRINAYSEKAPSSTGAKTDETPQKPTWPVKSSKEIKAALRESGRLFVRNLSYECTEEDLEKLFSTFGSLSDIHLSYDMKQQVSKGIAFVTFVFPADAVNAFEKLDKTKFMGRLLHILPADDPPEGALKNESHAKSDQGGLVRSEYQESKHKELKASATTAHNWNSLFVRPDAVATYLAAKFGLTKEQVLDPSGNSSVAVRLALAETQLVNEMREFLQKHHINVEAFNADSTTGAGGRRDRTDCKASSTHRQLSGTAFLIKNLPVGTTDVEVRELLKRYSRQVTRDGDSDKTVGRFYPKRVIVPPLGITAIVEYALAQEARTVYRSLAYEPYEDNVLYVQWLPHGALIEQVDAIGSLGEDRSDADADDGKVDAEFELITSLPDESVPSTEQNKTSVSKAKKRKLSANTETDGEKSTETPVVKQRKYKNKKERIRQQEDIESVEIEQPDQPVELESTNALPSEPVMVESKKISKPVLLVKNVAFQATRKELSALFEHIGGLMKVRLPHKTTGGHRGFAFVEFATVDQAKTALETLGTDTHFLGRRLRIEFAQQ